MAGILANKQSADHSKMIKLRRDLDFNREMIATLESKYEQMSEKELSSYVKKVNKALAQAAFDACDKEQYAQAELEAREYEAAVGGGVLTVKMNGKKQLLSVKIAEEVVDPDDIETLTDVLIAAVNQAIKTVTETNNSHTSSFIHNPKTFLRKLI